MSATAHAWGEMHAQYGANEGMHPAWCWAPMQLHCERLQKSKTAAAAGPSTSATAAAAAGDGGAAADARARPSTKAADPSQGLEGSKDSKAMSTEETKECSEGIVESSSDGME